MKSISVPELLWTQCWWREFSSQNCYGHSADEEHFRPRTAMDTVLVKSISVPELLWTQCWWRAFPSQNCYGHSADEEHFTHHERSLNLIHPSPLYLRQAFLSISDPYLLRMKLSILYWRYGDGFPQKWFGWRVKLSTELHVLSRLRMSVTFTRTSRMLP
jgi:hypothetical protein